MISQAIFREIPLLFVKDITSVSYFVVFFFAFLEVLEKKSNRVLKSDYRQSCSQSSWHIFLDNL